MSFDMDLTKLREQIGEVDRSLLELLRRRMALADEVGQIKASSGAPVVVRDVENRVLTRAREHAAECGVSEQVMEAIFEAIIHGSVERQHRVGVARRAERGGLALILGGAGAMGGWFSRFLGLVGHHVDSVDPAWGSGPTAPGRYTTLAEVPDIDRYDLLVVAVPLAQTPRLLDELVARRPRGVVVEISSIKTPLQDALSKARTAGVTVSSLHPMFGPAMSPYEPLTFVLACQNEPAEERGRIEAFLRHPYTNLVTIPFAHHDRLMGWLLGLAHLTSMVFAAALSRSGLDPRELRQCASTTFTRQAATAISVLSEDPDLYLDIQRLNPHRHQVYGVTRDVLDELVGLVSAGDREGFRGALALARSAVVGTE